MAKKIKYTNPKTEKHIIIEFTNCEIGGCSTAAGAAEILECNTTPDMIKEFPDALWWEDMVSESIN